ncbi:sensor histidine kinase [Spirillospora sp. CA-294931]|uniref:sensor histidine kinase n=1 Tax=Spirillospora sp. CA-294931 TaxID=3240042 RepID=UPI003D8B8587
MRPRTARQRFTTLYSVLFLLSGAVLLAIANIGASSTSQAVPAGDQPIREPSIADAHARIAQLQEQLADQQTESGQRLLIASVIALAVMAVVSTVLGRVVAGRVLRPLRTMTAATRRISADNLHERLAVRGPSDEVKSLADTIDELLGRLEGAFSAQRRFVANASHELRTPLATMRASLDVAMAKPDPVPPQTAALAGRLRTELDQVDRLLEGFLILARTQHTAVPDATSLSLTDLVSSALRTRAADAITRDLTVREHHNGDATVHGNATLLSRMVDNLIDNAIRHNDHGGWINASTITDGSSVRLEIETGGRTLDPAQVAQLAQPFHRLGADRTGSDTGVGLGLSIVAAIAATHNGTLTLTARPEGGLKATVTLPRETP